MVEAVRKKRLELKVVERKVLEQQFSVLMMTTTFCIYIRYHFDRTKNKAINKEKKRRIYRQKRERREIIYKDHNIEL